MCSMRQPLGVVTYPLTSSHDTYKVLSVIVVGTFILKPSERDPSVPMALADFTRSRPPEGILQVVNGETRLKMPDDNETSVGFVGSTRPQNTYTRRLRYGKRVLFCGAKSYADHAGWIWIKQ